MATWESGATVSVCKNCGATVECETKDRPSQDRGTCDCPFCGAELHKWHNSRHHEDCKVLKAGDPVKLKA